MLKGEDGLRRRMGAISSTKPLMGRLAVEVVERAKRKVPKKTRNLMRSIEVGRVTDDKAFVHARANYAGDVEFGTKPHKIRPRRVRALRFAASASGQRLSGSARRGAGVVFARSVSHPGTRAQPYMLPAIRETARGNGMRDHIVNAWNKAS
jgi:hypothetical protein